MTAPQRNTAATPESNDGVAAPAVGPASVNTESIYMRPLGATPVACAQCGAASGHVIGCPDSVPPRDGFKSFDERRDYYTDGTHSIDCAAETEARELRILSAFYAHLKQEDEQAARVERFRLHEGDEVFVLGEYSDEADDEPTEDDANYWIDTDGWPRRDREPPHA